MLIKTLRINFLIQKMTVHQRRIILMLLMKVNQLLSRKKMKKLNQNNKRFPMMSQKQNRKKTLMILQSHTPNLPVVKKTSNHLQNEQEWVGEEVVESEAVGSEEGELEEEEEIDLEQQPV